MNRNEKPPLKEITRINLNEPVLKKFLAALRVKKAWESTERTDYAYIFGPMVAFTLLSLFFLMIALCSGGSLSIILWAIPFWIVLWTCGLQYYWGERGRGEGSELKDLDCNIEVIHKAIKRGKVGMRKRSNYADSYELVGVYHNDLIGEDVEKSIPLSQDLINELYEALDNLGNFPDRFDSIVDDVVNLPQHTMEIPLQPKTQNPRNRDTA